MVSEISKKISNYIVSNGSVDDEEVLAYGAECLINQLISGGLLLIVGFLTNHVLELLVWSFSYSILRINLGGLHAPTHFWCIVIGTFIGASSMFVSSFWQSHIYLTIICLALAVVASVIIAPVSHKHKQHLQEHRKKIKQKVIVTLVCECLVIIIFALLGLKIIASYIVSGIIMATALAVLGMIFNPR